MAKVLTVTKLTITTHTGANRRPSSGSAKFSDGKFYDWMRVPEGDIRFFTSRRTHEGTGWCLFPFDSPVRAAAIESELA